MQASLPLWVWGIRLKRREEYLQGEVRHVHLQRSQQGMLRDRRAHHNWNEGRDFE